MEGTTVNLPLGSITVARKHSPLSLELTASFLINSETITLGLNQLTATGLFQHSKDGNLWMAKSGSCQLVFKTFINGQLPDPNVINPAIISSLIGMAAECPDEDEKTETSYFLCHPDLSSETIVPPPVTCVKFKGLVCKINLQIDASWRAGGRRRPSTKANEEPIQVEPEPPVAEESGPGKRRNPRWITRAANVKYADTSRQPDRKARLDTQPDSTNSESDAVILLSISKEEQKEMALFLDVALRKLIGVKHTSPGVKITEDTQFPSLIEIAPAVWNIRYLQSMTAHAKTIPAISNGIARLRNARSATLREKVNRLLGAEAVSSTPSHPDNLEDGIRKEVEKRLWLLCQTSIRVEPIVKNSKRKVKGDGEVPADTLEEEILEKFTQLTEDGWANHHHSFLAYDYPFDLFEEGTDTDMETDTDAVEYEYQYELGNATLLEDGEGWLSEDHTEEETYGESELDLGNDDREVMALYEPHPSSEGDYVYADGLGNLHPIPRHQAIQAGQIDGLAGDELPFEEEYYEEEFGDAEEYLGGYLQWDFA
ncbi:hypothetical protein SMACR_02486 [Sordaria macrospora]|uniref:WGS project CABT00000000 data, contig 2.3 n=2 Tax=Sordaria macrospora TaxID=5147 RepID=F7VPQ4_SORMK|nr:uncharacterized protein SMAC_02486 [Sordaria macrospora k-hell]KAA8629748.1 hypothetical protein SMACR_02486 [Sordaria macrospora]KAH7627059.1 hypothetical protein B0T09DRAFT_312602 [Sordaria sp. MPI-SDFR-AT-0083]CCC07482.1 unnamed protein product [Sordaria macrospora k-hell]